MTLAEEYLKRHSIEKPFIKHVGTGCMFFRTEQTNFIEWNIVTISYQPDNSHPGYYNIRKTRPRKNGFDAGQLFETTQNDRVEWDQYEDHLLTAVEMMRIKKAKPIDHQKEIVLVGWEMFAYMCDSHLRKYAKDENFWISLDGSASVVDRYRAYSVINTTMSGDGCQCYTVWSREIMELVRRYSHWLAKFTG